MPFTVEGKVSWEVEACTESEPVTLVMGNMGVSRPLPEGWQASAGIRCPEHRRGSSNPHGYGRDGE